MMQTASATANYFTVRFALGVEAASFFRAFRYDFLTEVTQWP